MLWAKIWCCIEVDSKFYGLALFKQKQILTGLLVTKSCKKSEDCFIQLLYAWLHLTNNNFTASKFLTNPYF